jgi:HD superfamily phosphohydrolase
LTSAFAGDVDVDRCDFILRDAFQTGVAHGRYDLDWLVSTLAVGVTADDKPVLGFDLNKAPRVVEQLLIARRALYDTVYHHRAVRGAEGMVGLLLNQVRRYAEENGPGIQIEGFEALSAAVAGSPLTITQVRELDDESLAVFIRRLSLLELKDAPAIPRLAKMLLRRDLFKPIAVRTDELARQAYEEEGALKSIDDVLEKSGYVPGRSFRFLDEAKFSFFHSKDPNRGSWLVDLSARSRPATPVRLNPMLVHHDEQREMMRLYVPREVRDQVTDSVKGLGFAG